LDLSEVVTKSGFAATDSIRHGPSLKKSRQQVQPNLSNSLHSSQLRAWPNSPCHRRV
jgi:hypothetical protein